MSVVLSSQEISSMHKIVVKNLTDVEIDQYIFIDQIRQGIEIEKDFHQKSFGPIVVPREGRIKWTEVEKMAPNYLKLFESFKFDDLNDGKYDELFINDESYNEELEEAKEEEDTEMIESLTTIKKEIDNLSKAGMKIDRQSTWDLFKIVRGLKRKQRFEDDGLDVERLLKLQAEIPAKKMKRMYDRRKARFE